MADAEVGDDVYGEDPTVNRLESLAAALLGKEAALYVPSGTMANQLALRLLGRARHRGALRRARARVPLRARGRRPGTRGVQLRPLPDADGLLVRRRHRRARSRRSSTTCPRSPRCRIENTYMPASGRPWRRGRDRRGGRASRATAGSRVHCDGARIWNAAIALGVVAARRSSRGADTVMFCLSKGLGAPVGSLLCGAARRDRRGARAPAAARRRDAPGRRDRGRRHRRARDDGRAAGRRPRARAAPRRRARRARSRAASTPSASRPTSCARGATALPRRSARRARRARASVPAPSTPTPCASSPTRTSTTPTSTRTVAVLDDLA